MNVKAVCRELALVTKSGRLRIRAGKHSVLCSQLGYQERHSCSFQEKMIWIYQKKVGGISVAAAKPLEASASAVTAGGVTAVKHFRVRGAPATDNAIIRHLSRIRAEPPSRVTAAANC
ncbi:hypothetical protein CB1_000667041 [Camelus ferus]|nr:hypothetical protein CB1_000667041 [Camelus ferus]